VDELSLSRSQGVERSSLPIVEIDTSLEPPVFKINPLANWDYDQVWTYIRNNNVPYNLLHDEGYKSIGDVHSTIKSSEGQGERDGRWAGQSKSECGLHKDYFKLKAAAKAATVALLTSSFTQSGKLALVPALDSLVPYRSNLVFLKNLEYNSKLGITLDLQSIGCHVFSEPAYTVNDEESVHGTLSQIATLFSSNPIPYRLFDQLARILPNIASIKVLNRVAENVTVLEFRFGATPSQMIDLETSVLEFCAHTKLDVVFQEDNVLVRHKRLVIFDMDSTLIRQEVIDELAREAGVYESISSITESAMFDFDVDSYIGVEISISMNH
jgi:hypothetical protein